MRACTRETMVSSNHMEDGGAVTEARISSVVPARVTAENTVHIPTAADLATKLHYLRGVYFFEKEALEGLSVGDLKRAMFPLLNVYYPVAGRVRWSDDGLRPVIKCNDSGVRVVEASVGVTLQEWMLRAKERGRVDDRLAFDHVLGPDLGFSPLVFVQFTRFKCGGISVGLSWAHILGDAFVASAFINTWARIIAGQAPTQQLPVAPTRSTQNQLPPPPSPSALISLKKIDPVNDIWMAPGTAKMDTLTVSLTSSQLTQLLSDVGDGSRLQDLQPFHVIAALIWKSLAKIRAKSGVKTVTICSKNPGEGRNWILGNSQLIGTVEADFPVAKAAVSQLAKLIMEKRAEANKEIEEFAEGDDGQRDFVLYGASLSFLNLEGTNIYGAELNGRKPVFANYTVRGVGDAGVILVLPGKESGKNLVDGGRTVTMVLPEDELVELKNELKDKWGR